MRPANEVLKELDELLVMQDFHKALLSELGKKIWLVQQEAYEAMEDQDTSELTYDGIKYKTQEELDFKLTEAARAIASTWDDNPEFKEFVEREDPGLGKTKWTVNANTRKAWLKKRVEAGLPLPPCAEQFYTNIIKYTKTHITKKMKEQHESDIQKFRERIGLEKD